MDAITALHGRNSVSQLSEPGPSAEQLQHILQAGYRANDRKHLRPWHFLIIDGDQRQHFAKLCLNALEKEQHAINSDSLSQEEKDKELAKPLRAPTIITVAAKIRPDKKVPDVEQLLSSAGAAQMMMLAAHALGLGAIWRTGWAAYNKDVHEGLGLKPEEGDKIVGFLYIGQAEKAKTLDEFNLDSIVKHWTKK